MPEEALSAVVRGELSGRPDLSICIVNWNTSDHLQACLASIFASRGEMALEVTVVDNASRDNSADLVEQHFPQVSLIRNRHNAGFAVASNQAIRASRSDRVLLLNPDVRVCADALRALCAFLDQHPEAGAVVGRLTGYDGKLQRDYYRRDLSLWEWVVGIGNGLSWSVPLGLERRATATFDEHSPSKLALLPGGCMLVRRAVLERVGLLDEDFFVWFEDVDWSRRIVKGGWQLYYVPDAHFFHQGAASFASWGSDARSGQILLSFLLFVDKHWPRSTALLVRTLLAVNLFVHLGVSIVARRLVRAESPSRMSLETRWQLLHLTLVAPARLRHRRRWLYADR